MDARVCEKESEGEARCLTATACVYIGVAVCTSAGRYVCVPVGMSVCMCVRLQLGLPMIAGRGLVVSIFRCTPWTAPRNELHRRRNVTNQDGINHHTALWQQTMNHGFNGMMVFGHAPRVPWLYHRTPILQAAVSFHKHGWCRFHTHTPYTADNDMRFTCVRLLGYRHIYKIAHGAALCHTLHTPRALSSLLLPENARQKTMSAQTRMLNPTRFRLPYATVQPMMVHTTASSMVQDVHTLQNRLGATARLQNTHSTRAQPQVWLPLFNAWYDGVPGHACHPLQDMPCHVVAQVMLRKPFGYAMYHLLHTPRAERAPQKRLATQSYTPITETGLLTVYHDPTHVNSYTHATNVVQ